MSAPVLTLGGASRKSPNPWCGGYRRPSARPVPPPVAPHELATVLFPVRRRILDRLAHVVLGVKPLVL